MFDVLATLFPPHPLHHRPPNTPYTHTTAAGARQHYKNFASLAYVVYHRRGRHPPALAKRNWRNGSRIWQPLKTLHCGSVSSCTS